VADSSMHADVTWLRAFALISEATVIASPPPEVRNTLVDRFEAYAEGKRRSGFLKRVIATLSFDSNLQPALGLRATGALGSQRQFVYSSEVADVTINLRTRPYDGLADLYGQIFPVDGTDPGDFGAQLLNGASQAATTATNDLGEFSFGAVPPGTYEVLAYSDQVEIRITGVEVRRGR
jgi:polysaccharide lyase family 4-like protein